MTMSIAERVNAVPQLRGLPTDVMESRVVDVVAPGVTCTPTTPAAVAIVVIEVLTWWAKSCGGHVVAQ